MYKLVKETLFDGSVIDSNVVIRQDGACIPFDLANTDYQEYLKWIEQGNTPLPADEQGVK
jgi:hypothetical protein